MILTGTVRNVIDFGAFVDIGVKHDGLVHISEMSDKYMFLSFIVDGLKYKSNNKVNISMTLSDEYSHIRMMIE